MFLGEANNLLTQYLKHPNFKDFESRTPKLQDLTMQIQEKIKKIDTNHFLGQQHVNVGEETEKLFREFAKICEHGLK